MHPPETMSAERPTDGSTTSPREALSVLSLSLRNVGPFDAAELDFLPEGSEGDGETAVPVTIITGENGAGKSILIDAIRGAFGEYYGDLERPITRPNVPFEIALTIKLAGKNVRLSTGRLQGPNTLNRFVHLPDDFAQLPPRVDSGDTPAPGWVVDFWRSNLATDSYAIEAMSPHQPRRFLLQSLQGAHRNVDVTKLLVNFDYLRDSRVQREKRAGEVLYETARRIVALSLLDGELLDVARSTFMPMVRQGGQTVPLSSLSSGNAYMIQRMIGLLGKMYSVNTLREEEPERMCETPGVLLLDEAENHLHPRWQKRFLGDVLRMFPNLQIVATTHSPFVVGSVPGARVFVCRYDSEARSATVDDVTVDYADLPVEDILISPAFDGTESFGEEISGLMEAREHAIVEGNQATRDEIEAKLYDKNPRYFSYLKLDEHLRALRAAGSP